MTIHPNQTPSRELVALGSAAFLAIAGDFLFWRAWPGISLGIFALLATVALLWNRRGPWSRNAVIASLLLVPSAAQTGIEQSFSNVVVLGALVVVVAGETAFPTLRSGWGRWSEAVWAFCKPICAWWWLASFANRIPSERRLFRALLLGFLRVVLPALALGLVFTLLLGAGNAVFGRWSLDVFSTLFSWLAHLDVTVGRIFLWLLLGTFALSLMRPKNAPNESRIWTRPVPEFAPPVNFGIAFWRTIAILALLNVLFFIANTADALYLWTKAELPRGVSYSAFVHSGVYSLSAAVVLSAIVLVSLYQQTAVVRSKTAVRALSLLWIAQNFILIAGVFLRLVRYVDAYQLSELRIYVGCFLLLVTAGFVSLILHIFAPRGLNRLLFVNALATFALFFVLQFPDVAKWVAQYNVGRWQNDPARVLDVDYLGSLGPSAYPSLIQVAETPDRVEAHAAFGIIQSRKVAEEARLTDLNWRSYQLRKVRNAKLLAAHEVRTRR